MRTSYRQLAERHQRCGPQIENLIGERDTAKRNASDLAWALEQVAGELSRAKDVIASHLVAAGHPSTVLHDVRTFRDALTQALTDAGVDIRLELARLEGAEL
ncbi:hypothetical protein AB0C88_37850 [Streptomyces chartreusis]|uniref:hypothetical protein n=1 Tax=Streptomyces chartreusis TaxID=1969 RepID=UPI0033D0754A